MFASLSSGELGTWYLFFAVATFVGLSDVGLPATFGRAVSMLSGRQASPEHPSGPEIPAHYRGVSLPDLYASAFIATLLLSVVFALTALPAALLYFAHILPGGDRGQIIVPLLTFLGGVVLNLMAAIPGAYLSGSGNVTLDSAVRTTASLFGFALVYLLAPMYRSLESVCVAYLLQGAVAVAAGHLVVSMRRGVDGVRSMRLNTRLIRGMYRESASVFVSRLGGWLTAESTLLIAGSFLGATGIADLAILRQVVAIGASLTSAIPAAISPHVTAAYSAGDAGRVRSLYLAALRYTFIINLLWTVGLLLWAPTAIDLLVGREHFLGYSVLVPLAVGSFLELHGATHGYFIWSIGRWPFAPFVVAGGALNVALASIGCAFLSFVGLAWGSTAAQAATMYWAQPYFTLRHFGISARVYVVETVRPAAAYGAALLASGAALKWGFDALLATRSAVGGAGRLERAGWALTAVAATTLVASIFAWFLALTTPDRDYFSRLARVRR